MSTMNGNPHIYPGPQIADPDTINEGFIGEEGITAETMILSELTRNTEATLALAYEQRTTAMVGLLATLHPAYNTPGQMSDDGKRKTERLRDAVESRLDLNGDAS